MKLILSFLILLIVTPQKRIINDQDYDYEFFITRKKIKKPSFGKTYYWYKSRQIHTSVSDIGGALLTGEYHKYYKSKQLAEKGTFSKGLKDGIWKNWQENGNLTKVERWKKGTLHGLCTTYNLKGEKVSEGKFKNGRKHGTWIDYITKDTIRYKKGKILPKKLKDTTKREPFLKRLFKRKKKKSSKKQQTQNKKTDVVKT